jgi:nicotinamidase/pyrazinamidase
MTALLLVDIQNDFLPGGSLAVPNGNEILPVVTKLMDFPFDLIVASQDHHPEGHISFASTHGKKIGEMIHNQILWPDHCVQGSKGAELESSIDQERIARIFPKGSDPQIDSYSAFFDNQRLRSTGLGEYLREKKIEKIVVVGLATDYCVLWTTLDALSLGFKVDLVVEGCRGIDLRKGDVTAALKEMEKAGAQLV